MGGIQWRGAAAGGVGGSAGEGRDIYKITSA